MSLLCDKQPLVSAVISAYNASGYIAETVRSFTCQTYPFWEMIIVNDGSTDNSGMTLARKTGIGMARGKYILVFDSDDIIYPDAFRKLVDIAERTAADVVSVPFRFWYADGRKVDSVRLDCKEIDGVEYAFECRLQYRQGTSYRRRYGH